MAYKAKFICAVRDGWEHTELQYEYRGKTYWVVRHNNGYMDDPLWRQHKEAQRDIDERIKKEAEPVKEWKYEGSAQEGFDIFWASVNGD